MFYPDLPNTALNITWIDKVTTASAIKRRVIRMSAGTITLRSVYWINFKVHTSQLKAYKTYLRYLYGGLAHKHTIIWYQTKAELYVSMLNNDVSVDYWLSWCQNRNSPDKPGQYNDCWCPGPDSSQEQLAIGSDTILWSWSADQLIRSRKYEPKQFIANWIRV